MGLPSCIRTTPKPTPEASVSTTNSFEKLVIASTETVVIVAFKALNVVVAISSQQKASFFWQRPSGENAAGAKGGRPTPGEHSKGRKGSLDSGRANGWQVTLISYLVLLLDLCLQVPLPCLLLIQACFVLHQQDTAKEATAPFTTMGKTLTVCSNRHPTMKNGEGRINQLSIAEYEEFSALITRIRNEKGTESSSQGTKQSARKRIVKEKEVEEEGKEEKRKRNVPHSPMMCHKDISYESYPNLCMQGLVEVRQTQSFPADIKEKD